MQENSYYLKLILGTAQFGLKYGINNNTGKLLQKEVIQILKFAFENGIVSLDTAEAYGNSTELIGKFNKQNAYSFNIITKFKDLPNEVSLSSWLEFTLTKLKLSKIFACMYHSSDDYFSNPHLINQLIAFREQGFIENIGVSIYTNDEFEKVLEEPQIKIIQLPYNLLDNFSLRGNLIKKAKASGKIIHVRSVFLQGLFFMDICNLPEKLLPLKPNLALLHSLCKKHKVSMQSLAINYVNNNRDIDGIIIGVDNINQLKSNIGALKTNIPEELFFLIDNIVTDTPELLNPVNWS